MLSLALEPTNACNRRCLHCSQNKADPPEFMSLDRVEKILVQARKLGLERLHLYGGEIAVYPDLSELLRLIVRHDFTFGLVTNGFRFEERLLPLLLEPSIQRKNMGVCFSIDGVRAKTHDVLRGTGSFAEVLEAIGLCILKKIPRALKSVITSYNKDELTELALLGAGWEVLDHTFLITHPTPKLIRAGAIPSPDEMVQICTEVKTLAKIVRGKILVEGYPTSQYPLTWCPAWQFLTVDSGCRQIFCCNLSHLVTGENLPTHLGEEWLADLNKVSLKEGMKRHFYLLAKFMEARLNDLETLSGLNKYLCYWCMKYFGKLEWLKNFPDSPWAAGVLDG